MFLGFTHFWEEEKVVWAGVSLGEHKLEHEVFHFIFNSLFRSAFSRTEKSSQSYVAGFASDFLVEI